MPKLPKFTREEIEDLCKKYDLIFKNISPVGDMYADYKLFIRGDGFFERGCWSRYFMKQGAWNTIASFNTKDKQTFMVDSIGTKILHREYNDNDFFVVSNFNDCYNYTKSEFIALLEEFVKNIRIKMKKYLTEKKLKELEGDFK